MAGKIKRLSRSDGVAVDAPTALAFDGTLTAATVGGDDNDGTDGYVLLKDQSADPSPTSGDDIKIFCKDKGLYKVDSTGVASEVGSGTGSGELNYITNPSGAVDTTGWAESTDGEVDISRTTTASELPRENLVGTGLKIVGTGTTAEEYVSFDFNLDDSDLNKVLKIEWDQKPLGSYADGELEVVIYDLDNTAEIIPSITEIPAMTGKFQTIWVTDSTSTNYELRIKNPNASATDGIVISNVIVGPGSRVQMPDPRWPSYTTTTLVTGTDWTTNNVDLIPYQTSDDTWRLKLNIYGSLGTAASSVVLTIDDVTSSYFQALSVTNATSSRVGSAVFNSTTDKINAWIVTGATGTGWIISGDIAIDDKPTWATKSAPDLYLSGAVNTDQVVAVYNGGGVTIAGGTIDSTARILTFPGTTYIRDTDSAYSSGTFTAPSSGEYFISANVRVNDSGWAANEYVDLYIYKEGSVVAMATVRAQTSGSFELQPNVNSSIYLTAGETIDIRLASNGGATSFSTTNSNTLSIVKLPSPQDVANMIVGFNTATEDRPGLVSAYKYEELTANSGDFTNGETLRIAKVGSVVTLTWPALAHAAKSVPISAAGLIPSIYLPNDIFYNLSYSAGGTVSRVSITTDGKIEFTHRDWAGVAVTPTSSAGGSISWVVDE